MPKTMKLYLKPETEMHEVVHAVSQIGGISYDGPDRNTKYAGSFLLEGSGEGLPVAITGSDEQGPYVMPTNHHVEDYRKIHAEMEGALSGIVI